MIYLFGKILAEYIISFLAKSIFIFAVLFYLDTNRINVFQKMNVIVLGNKWF